MAFNRIASEGFRAPDAPPAETPAPQLQWIEIAALVVDDSYQREIERAGRKNVERIAESFDWACFSPVIVSPVEGGAYAIVDGQHRVTAAALIGKERVPCQVVIADRRKQALAYAAVNGNVTRQHTLQVFHAALGAGDPEAVAVNALAARAGVRILRGPRTASHMKPGDCVMVRGLKDCRRVYGDEVLFKALCALTKSGRDTRGLINDFVVRGLCVALSRAPLSAETVGKVFGAIDLPALRIRQRRDGFGGFSEFGEMVLGELAKIAKRGAGGASLGGPGAKP